MLSLVNYCLDTDVLIDFMDGEAETVKKVKDLLNYATLSTTTLTLCELYRGVYLKKDSENESKRVDIVKNNFIIFTLDENSAKVFGIKNKELSIIGKLTQEIDLIIASICIHNNLILITKNKKHFENIPELKVEFW